MRRIAITLVVVLIGGAFIALATGASNRDSNQSKYWVEMDSAFGLNAGGDMKVVGVRAGKITDIKLDRRTNRALVGFTIAQTGFGSLRSDVFCESRPQSLIGEYYLDCKPGNSPQVLRKTSPEHPIPVTQTASTISPDLVGDILREPYRQRFSIILSELGAGVAGNGQNLNAAIQRAVPALRETDSVLAILARQNTVLANLATQGDAVLHDLSNNRADVQRFVVSAGNAARDSAARKANIEAGFARLPGFLAALQPAMVSLGNLAVSNTPALRNLNASARQLTRLFNNLGPFATVSTPAFASLGQASVTGDQAVKAATPTVQQLNTFAQGAPELAQNLSIILQHLNDPQFGAEHDPRAVAQHPQNGSNTYTGLESLLQYVFDQAGNTTYFDQNSHLLGLSTFLDPTTCSPYADAARAKAQPASCRAWLGPTQPGVTTPDPTQLVATPAAKVAAKRTQQPVASLTPTNAPRSQTPAGAPSSGPSGAPGASTSSPGPCILGVCLPTPQVAAPTGSTPSPSASAGSGAPAGPVSQQGQPSGQSQSSQTSLLNYLLAP